MLLALEHEQGGHPSPDSLCSCNLVPNTLSLAEAAKAEPTNENCASGVHASSRPGTAAASDALWTSSRALSKCVLQCIRCACHGFKNMHMPVIAADLEEQPCMLVTRLHVPCKSLQDGCLWQRQVQGGPAHCKSMMLMLRSHTSGYDEPTLSPYLL